MYRKTDDSGIESDEDHSYEDRFQRAHKEVVNNSDNSSQGYEFDIYRSPELFLTRDPLSKLTDFYRESDPHFTDNYGDKPMASGQQKLLEISYRYPMPVMGGNCAATPAPVYQDKRSTIVTEWSQNSGSFVSEDSSLSADYPSSQVSTIYSSFDSFPSYQSNGKSSSISFESYGNADQSSAKPLTSSLFDWSDSDSSISGVTPTSMKAEYTLRETQTPLIKDLTDETQEDTSPQYSNTGEDLTIFDTLSSFGSDFDTGFTSDTDSEERESMKASLRSSLQSSSDSPLSDSFITSKMFKKLSIDSVDLFSDYDSDSDFAEIFSDSMNSDDLWSHSDEESDSVSTTFTESKCSVFSVDSANKSPEVRSSGSSLQKTPILAKKDTKEKIAMNGSEVKVKAEKTSVSKRP